MIGRVIEIASEGQHLGRKRGLMTVSCNGAETGRVPLDDIGVLLCNARGLTYSNDLLIQLAERGAAVVLCGNDYLPVAWLWPLEGPCPSIADALPVGGAAASTEEAMAGNGPGENRSAAHDSGDAG